MKLGDVKKLRQKKYRDEFGFFLAEGEHPVMELQKAAAENPLLRSCELFATRDYAHWPSPFQIHLISPLQMAQIADTKTPQGIIALVPMLPAAPPRDGETGIYLPEVQDPGNLGAILRTLAWFGGFRCLLGPGSVDPFNGKVVRASMGAIFHVPVETQIDGAALGGRFARIACLDVRGEMLPSPRFGSFDCYVFGNEARGLPEGPIGALEAQPFTIAGCGAIDSLNLAAAVNIAVYELRRSPNESGGRLAAAVKAEPWSERGP